MRMATMLAALIALHFGAATARAQQADEPELIFKKSTVFRLLSPDAKLATYAIDDPGVEGVACWLAVRLDRWRSGKNSNRARKSTANAARCSSRKCKSCAAAMPSAMCWFISPTRTKSSKAHHKTPPPPCPSCLGAISLRCAVRITSNEKRPGKPRPFPFQMVIGSVRKLHRGNRQRQIHARLGL